MSGPVLWAQEPPRDAEVVRVTARVHDAESGAPLLGALIELSGLPRRYVTGMHGQVTLEVPLGHYTFTVHKGGYATLRGDFGVIGPSDLAVAMHELGDVDASIPERLLVRVAEFGTGRLIEGASVSLPGGQGGLTDGSGWVEFGDVGGAVAEVTVQMIGYRKRTEPVTMHEGRTTVVEVAMSIDAVVLAPLEVEVRSGFLEAQGVYWRMDHNRTMHVFDSDDLIERGAVPYLTEAFRKIPNLHVYGGGRILGRRKCEIAIYWDGMPMGSSTAPWLPDEIPPKEIELVEVYTGLRTPLRFSRWPGDINDCGAIAFWSRRRADRNR
ncbi:MAG: hypothetical protein OXL34_18630 [Gemmatimonadota bacterium]|nr:hypothetical protein [Gemmatimonadota bacterium]